MKKFFLKFFTYILIITLYSCGNDSDDNIINFVPDNTIINPEPEIDPTETVLYLEINDFIWENLNQYYYWQNEVSDLSDEYLNNSNTYLDLLKTYSDSENFFESLKYKDDRFSWIRKESSQLENALAGISASNGLIFDVYYKDSSNTDLIGIVRYVLPNSNASETDIKRGDIFTGVNNITLTPSNYIQLLYGNNLTYNLNMAEYTDGVISSTEKIIKLTKVENFQENPIQLSKIINVGEKKVGYLMYNQFLSSFEENLISVFDNFKFENISDLILDLRYNPGGSVNNATYTASMIAGQLNGEIFAKEIWNSKMNDFYQREAPDRLVNLFSNVTSTGKNLPNLNLNKIYVITSNRTASASELLINGLKPYIDVIQIGDKTSGKNVGSITLYDYIDNNGTINPRHNYAMQPVVLKIANGDGFSDYDNGLEPNYEILEDKYNLGIIGDVNEPLLAETLSRISGTSKKLPKLNNNFDRPFFNPLDDRKTKMYLEDF